MKKNTIWKVLGASILAAAVIPLKVKKDEDTGKKTYQSLLLSVDVGPDQETGEGTAIGINVGEGLLSGPLTRAVAAKKEDGLFADDEPEAAVVPDIIDFAQEAAKVREENAPAEKPAAPAPAHVDETGEEDFDPEL